MTDVTASALADALRDRCTLERELGRGGMATVYLARDLRHDRDVALKLLRPDLDAVLGRERFLAEIRLTAKLDHPHILTLIDSGESGGLLWYVVPCIRGESLRQKTAAREATRGRQSVLYSAVTQVGSQEGVRWYIAPFDSGAARAITPGITDVIGLSVTNERRPLLYRLRADGGDQQVEGELRSVGTVSARSRGMENVGPAL